MTCLPTNPALNGLLISELVNEVDELLAKSGINVSIEGDTEENIDMANITIDEVREFE